MSQDAAPEAGKQNGATLEARGVTIRFEGLTAVDSVNEMLHQGEILGLIGPNGAGKTTLVNAMTGFQVPAAGEVLLSGKVISKLTPHWIRRHGVARTFQAGRLFRDMPVSENVEVAAVSLGLSRRKAHAQAMDILEWIGPRRSGERSRRRPALYRRAPGRHRARARDEPGLRPCWTSRRPACPTSNATT